MLTYKVCPFFIPGKHLRGEFDSVLTLTLYSALPRQVNSWGTGGRTTTDGTKTDQDSATLPALEKSAFIYNYFS